MTRFCPPSEIFVLFYHGRINPASRNQFYEMAPEISFTGIQRLGWYRTGDLATIDEDGYLRITGRVKDVVNRGGEKVPVAEIEQLLHEHPLVEEVAIVAMPDERLGERACAFVVRSRSANGGEAELDLDALRSFLDGREVSRHYWPERVVEIEAMPRTPSGKIQKFVLRERARELRAEDQGTAASRDESKERVS